MGGESRSTVSVEGTENAVETTPIAAHVKGANRKGNRRHCLCDTAPQESAVGNQCSTGRDKGKDGDQG